MEALQWEAGLSKPARPGLRFFIEWGHMGKSERDMVVRTLELAPLALLSSLHHVDTPADVLFERLQTRGREVSPLNLEALLSAGSRHSKYPRPRDSPLRRAVGVRNPPFSAYRIKSVFSRSGGAAGLGWMRNHFPHLSRNGRRARYGVAGEAQTHKKSAMSRKQSAGVATTVAPPMDCLHLATSGGGNRRKKKRWKDRLCRHPALSRR